jgi:alpha-galactosidase
MIKPVWKDMPSGRILTLRVTANNKITFHRINVSMEMDMENAKVMQSGYQTWTWSNEVDKDSRAERLNPLALNLLKPYGDYGIVKAPKGRGHIYSWTYTYVRKPAGTMALLGSCSEDFGFTIFDIDMQKNKVEITKDCEGMEFTGEDDLMSIYMGTGEEIPLWDEYFSTIHTYRKSTDRCTGWTSWYNYYTSINEDIIMKNLKALHDEKIQLNIFQIDDGYQHAVGDWLDINDKFPSGLKKVADEISGCGYKPGLWISPFICEKKSYVFKNHPEWLLKDGRGRLVKAGWNPNWSGTFYSLDFYNEGFREYLKKEGRVR